MTYQEDAGPGVFAEAIRERGDSLDTWLVPEQADPLNPSVRRISSLRTES